MKSTTRSFASLTLVVLAFLHTASAGAAAILYWQDVDRGGPLDFLHEPWGANDNSYDLSYENTWDLTGSGYNPAIHGIDGITVWFAFADDRPGYFEGAEAAHGGDVAEHVDISLGGAMVWDDLEVDGQHPVSSYAYYAKVLDPVGHAAIFSDLAADGRLAYTVELQQLLNDTGSEGRNSEDTYLKVAKIKAWHDPSARRVPEGGASLVLFGLGLAGVVGLSRLRR